MRLLLILIFLTYVNAKFGRSYRSSDKEVLPAVPVKNISSSTVDKVVGSLSPATTSTTTKRDDSFTKPEPSTTIYVHHDYDKDTHDKTQDLNIKSLKQTLEHERHGNAEEHNDKLKKVVDKSGNELTDASDEQSYDEMEEKVQKDLADQYKDEDDYSSAEQLRASSPTLSTPQTSKLTTPSSVTNVTGSSTSNTNTARPSTIVAVTNASTSASTVASAATQGSKRTTILKASRRNAGAVEIAVSLGTVDTTVHMTDATLGKMDIGRRKTTRYPKTTTEKEFVELEQKYARTSTNNDVAQPQKLSGLKNISDYQPRRIYETSTKRVIEILRTLKYKKNGSPGTILNMERNLEKAINVLLSLSILALSSST